jgi:TonB family protein
VPIFLGFSVLAHLVFAASLVILGGLRGCLFVPSADDVHRGLSNNGGASSEPIDISMIEPAPIDPFASPFASEIDQAEIQKKLEEARKEEDDPEAHGQVVDIPKPAVEVRPDDAKLVSEYDSKVDRETVAKGRAGERPSMNLPVPPAPRNPIEAQPPADPRLPAEGHKGRGSMAMRTNEGRGAGGDGFLRADGDPEGFDVAGDDGDLMRKGTGEGGDAGDSKRGTGKQGEEGEGEAVPGVGELRPSEESLAKVVGEGSSDYLEDIDEGAETLLNTKRWKYATFFNRVKRAVAQNWHPDTAYRLRDPTGQIYGQKNRLTILKVSIHPDGKIRDILIEKPCGVDFLDDEAVSAFRAAQPFPNPPSGLVDKESNLITFRFGFFFEISSAPSFRIFRYSN